MCSATAGLAFSRCRQTECSMRQLQLAFASLSFRRQLEPIRTGKEWSAECVGWCSHRPLHTVSLWGDEARRSGQRSKGKYVRT